MGKFCIKSLLTSWSANVIASNGLCTLTVVVRYPTNRWLQTENVARGTFVIAEAAPAFRFAAKRVMSGSERVSDRCSK